MFAGRVAGGRCAGSGCSSTGGLPRRADVGWRKTALFDRFLSFDVELSQEGRTGH